MDIIMVFTTKTRENKDWEKSDEESLMNEWINECECKSDVSLFRFIFVSSSFCISHEISDSSCFPVVVSFVFIRDVFIIIWIIFSISWIVSFPYHMSFCHLYFTSGLHQWEKHSLSSDHSLLREPLEFHFHRQIQDHVILFGGQTQGLVRIQLP